jgi:hypothetical protein
MKYINFSTVRIKNENRGIIDRYMLNLKNDPIIPERVKDNLGVAICIASFYSEVDGVLFEDLLQE